MKRQIEQTMQLNISIPSGAIKSIQLKNYGNSNKFISIPSGAIKSLFNIALIT